MIQRYGITKYCTVKYEGFSITIQLTCNLDLNHVAGLLGVNEVTGELYGVSMDRRDRLVSRRSTGPWYGIDASEWDKIKDSLNKVIEIPNIPTTGLTQTDESLPVLTLTTNSGDSFSGKLSIVCVLMFVYVCKHIQFR